MIIHFWVYSVPFSFYDNLVFVNNIQNVLLFSLPSSSLFLYLSPLTPTLSFSVFLDHLSSAFLPLPILYRHLCLLLYITCLSYSISISIQYIGLRRKCIVFTCSCNRHQIIENDKNKTLIEQLHKHIMNL